MIEIEGNIRVKVIVEDKDQCARSCPHFQDDTEGWDCFCGLFDEKVNGYCGPWRVDSCKKKFKIKGN